MQRDIADEIRLIDEARCQPMRRWHVFDLQQTESGEAGVRRERDEALP
ncbi:MAG TPA: hypothetical protein VGH81_00505 [Rudaea sp.]